MGKLISIVLVFLWLYSCRSSSREHHIENETLNAENKSVIDEERKVDVIFDFKDSVVYDLESKRCDVKTKGKNKIWEIFNEESLILTRILITTLDTENNTIIFVNDSISRDSILFFSEQYLIKYDTEYDLKTYNNSFLFEKRDYDNVWIKGVIDSIGGSKLEFHYGNIEGRARLLIKNCNN